MSSGIGRMPRPLGRVYGVSPGTAGAQVVIGMPGHMEASTMVSRGGLLGCGWYRPSQAAAGVVAAPRVAAVGAEEHVLPAAAVLGGAGAPWVGLFLDLPGQQVAQELGEVDRQAGLPVRAAVGVILRREPVKRAPDLAELPLDVDLVVVDVVALQADRLAPAQAGVGDGDDHGEVLSPAGQERGALGDQQCLQRRGPRALRATVQPAAGPPAAVSRPGRGVVRNQRRLRRCGVAKDRAQHRPSITGHPPGDAGPCRDGVLPPGDVLGGK